VRNPFMSPVTPNWFCGALTGQLSGQKQPVARVVRNLPTGRLTVEPIITDEFVDVSVGRPETLPYLAAGALWLHFPAECQGRHTQVL
jgi:hypothetical protein